MIFHVAVILLMIVAVAAFLILWYFWVKNRLAHSLALHDEEQVLFPFRYFSWILMGLVVGTGLGAGVSKLFIPFLQVGTGPSAQIPPFIVQIAWPAIFRIYVLFGLMFVAALGGLTALLLRMRIFQAVKLGETT